MLLTQDAAFGDGPVPQRNRTHVLSTREWLKTLVCIGVVPRARDIIAEIEADGRRVGRYMTDKPARLTLILK